VQHRHSTSPVFTGRGRERPRALPRLVDGLLYLTFVGKGITKFHLEAAGARGTHQIRRLHMSLYDKDDLLDSEVLGEDGLPCRHPDLDWLGKAATCPECGEVLFPLVPPENAFVSINALTDPGPEDSDLPDADIDGPKEN